MRPAKVSIIITYIAAIMACVMFVASWFHVGDAPYATYLAVQACFLLLAGIWAHVCSYSVRRFT